MRALRILAVCCLAIAASPASGAEDTSRSYAKRSCSERNANPNDCLIQDGPPRRSAFGGPAAVPPTPPATPAQPSAATAGNGVTILGGSNSATAKGGK